MISEIHVGNAADDKLSITMRGEATEIVKVLTNGLPREALEQLRDAMEAELARRAVASSAQEG